MFIKCICLGCIILMSAFKHLRVQASSTETFATPESPPWAFRMSQYNCHLFKTCIAGGPPACGWDEIWHYLAMFRDICAMYNFNCRSRGRFSYIVQNNVVCQLKSEFVNNRQEVPEHELPTSEPTKRTTPPQGIQKTKEWWWDGSTTNQYKYLESFVVDRHKL